MPLRTKFPISQAHYRKLCMETCEPRELLTAVKIAHELNGGPRLEDWDRFGDSVASIGDLDDDGINDFATASDSVRIVLMNSDGTAKSTRTLVDGDFLGRSLTSIGDLDGNGVNDLAVGNHFENHPSGAVLDCRFSGRSCGAKRGAVRILLMDVDGSVKSTRLIAHELNGGPTLADYDFFGDSVTSLGDLNGDGIKDLAIGATGDDTIRSNNGAVYVLLMNSDGTVKISKKIATELNGGPNLANGDSFGSAVTSLGDLDGDGIHDLAVGAESDRAGGSIRGAVYVLLMNADGTAKSTRKIAHELNGGPILADRDDFGTSVAFLGDVDGDGINDLAVGADGGHARGSGIGAVHLLLMNPDGSVKSTQKISHQFYGGPTLAERDFFGSSVALLGDLDGDGISEIAVGARGDNTGGEIRGAVYVLRIANQQIDLNRDSWVNTKDIDLLFQSIGTAGDSRFDLDEDKDVDQDDVHAFLAVIGTVRGDADLDGDVDFSDFLALATAFSSLTGKEDVVGWVNGDFDGDGQVTFDDFVVLSTNFGF